MRCSCIACRPPGRGGDRRSHRRTTVGGLGRGGKPVARAKALMEYLLLGRVEGEIKGREMSDIKKVVLAYSGGLDTSVILKWLQDNLQVRSRHLHRRPRSGRGTGASPCQGAEGRHQTEEHLHRRRARRVRPRLRLPMFRANTVYEGEYLLGTSIARRSSPSA